MPAAFSRLQLAAALLEYDNDSENPEAPRRSAQESAIFAHLRKNPAARPKVPTRKSENTTVPLSTAGPESIGGVASKHGTRRSKASRDSVNILRNPFGQGDDYSTEEEDLEVDLASWGLDAFMPKDKDKSSKVKGKQAESNHLPPPVTSVRSHHPSTNHDIPATSPKRALGAARSMSLGGRLDYFGVGEHTERHLANQIDTSRRRSIASPLDLAGMEATGSFAISPALESPAITAPAMIPFPSVSVRSLSPKPHDARYHERRRSTTMMEEGFEGDRRRVVSTAIEEPVENDNPFALEPPTHISRFDPKAAARARTASNTSMGSRLLLENDDASIMTRTQSRQEPRYSTTLDLLRPKVLVMPSPLQSVTATPHLQPEARVRNGFELSTDGPPLPPGARSSRRLSISASILDSSSPIPSNPLVSNLFTPNPLNDLSLSQKTFRNTLGAQVGLYIDDIGIPRATEDGEQIDLDPTPPDDTPVPIVLLEDTDAFKGRPAGKLYGKSLIDDLESRKANMRGKQRVFTGDQRPSMMAREHSSTLIDPSTLQVRPTTARLSSYGSSDSRNVVGRRNSLGKPLLNFEDDVKGTPTALTPNNMSGSRSVFGVDTLWEREMAKLKEIQEREKEEEEERKRKEEQQELKKDKKRKKQKGKGKVKEPELESEAAVPGILPDLQVSAEPPILPDITRTRKQHRKPSANDDDESSDSEQPRNARPVTGSNEWYASSEEENEGPRRTTGIGPRYRQPVAKRATLDSDSDEDLPLAATLNRARLPKQSNPDDEEKPLSALLEQAKSTAFSINFDTLSLGKGDDDDEPLGLRASRFPLSQKNNSLLKDDDDDQPLAFHPEHQRRTQYQMLAQQQQQQMMMQAQMQSNMFFSPSVMGSGFFPPVMSPMMMMPPISIPSPPPIHDEVKFGRVDRWRRDVAVEGEPAGS